MKRSLLKRTMAMLMTFVLIMSGTAPVRAAENYPDEETVNVITDDAEGQEEDTVGSTEIFTLEQFAAMMNDSVYMSEEEEKIYLGGDGWIYRVRNGSGSASPYEPEDYTYDAQKGIYTSDIGWNYVIQGGKVKQIYRTEQPDYVFYAYDRLTPDELTARIADKYVGQYQGVEYTLTKTENALVLSHGTKSETYDLTSWIAFETSACLMMIYYDSGYTVKFVLSDGAVTEIYKETYWENEWDLFARYTVNATETNGGTVTAEPAEAGEGDTVSLTITAEDGYELSGLTVTDQGGATVEVTNDTFVMPRGNVAVSATFEPVPEDVLTGSCGKNAIWTLANGVLTISGTGAMTNYDKRANVPWYEYRADIRSVVIEEGITSIADCAFCECTEMTGIDIADTVQSIGNNAFWKCSSLTGIDIPSGVRSIGYAAFEYSGLESVVIPYGVEKISWYTFSYCSSLKSVTVPETVTTISEYAFYWCEALEDITIPSGVTEISMYCFYKCSSLESINIPAGVTKIEFGAFSNCDLLDGVVIPESCKTIEGSAFYGSGITKINVPDGVACIDDFVFYGCPIQSIDIPDSVTSIGDNAFMWSSLRSIDIPNGVQSIGKEAFYGCRLNSLSIPDSVTSIGEKAFHYCRTLTSITIPAGVTDIAKDAFTRGDSVKDVYFLGTDFSGFLFDDESAVDDFQKPAKTTLHIPVSVDPASLTAETGGAIYYWYQANNASVVNDIKGDIRYPVTVKQTNGGTVSTEKESAVAGENVVLTVTPDSQHTVRNVTVNNGAVEVKANSDGTYSFSMPAANVTVSAEWRDVNPAFMTHSLALGGQIGVNFFLDLPERDGVDYNTSYMEFMVSGKTTKVPYDPTNMNTTKMFYGFTCYVNAIQMAETIKAVFHYTENNEDKTREETYTVEKYIALAMGRFDDTTNELLRTLYEYGYRSQIYLSEYNGWQLGVDYAEMQMYYVYDYLDEDYAEAKSAVVDEQVVKALTEDITKMTYALNLESETFIYLFFKMAGGYSGSFTAEVNGKEVSAVKMKDGRYRVIIPNIPAHKLKERYVVTIHTRSGTSTVNLSAMSYVRSFLNNDAASQSAKDLVTALYFYNKAALAYMNA